MSILRFNSDIFPKATMSKFIPTLISIIIGIIWTLVFGLHLSVLAVLVIVSNILYFVSKRFNFNTFDDVYTHLKEDEDTSWLQNYLENGGNPNALDSANRSFLFLAAMLGRRDAVQLLIDQGANIHWQQKAIPILKKIDFTPVLVAAAEGHDDVVQLLLEHGAEQDAFLAALRGDIELLKRQIESGVSVDFQNFESASGKPVLEGMSLLHLATWRESTAALEYLIQQGANLSIRDQMSRTPLHRAALNNNLEAVKILVASGAPVDVEDKDADTPLYDAVFKNNVPIARFLLEQGANVDARDNISEHPPLYLAVENNNLAMLQLLIDFGADVNYKHWSGDILRNAKSRKRNKEIIELLEKHSKG